LLIAPGISRDKQKGRAKGAAFSHHD